MNRGFSENMSRASIFRLRSFLCFLFVNILFLSLLIQKIFMFYIF